MVDDLTAANQKIVDAAGKALLSSVSTAQSLLGSLKTILTGPLAGLSPTDAYNQAKAQWATADASNAGDRGQALLEAFRGMKRLRQQLPG